MPFQRTLGKIGPWQSIIAYRGGMPEGQGLRCHVGRGKGSRINLDVPETRVDNNGMAGSSLSDTAWVVN